MDSPRVRMETIALTSLGDYLRVNRLPSVDKPRTKGSMERKPQLPKPLAVEGLVGGQPKQPVKPEKHKPEITKKIIPEKKAPEEPKPANRKENIKQKPKPAKVEEDSSASARQLAESGTSEEEADSSPVTKSVPQKKVVTRARFAQTDEVRFYNEEDEQREQELVRQVDELTNERNFLAEDLGQTKSQLDRTTDKSNRSSMQLVLMMIEMLRQDYLRLHPEDDVKGLPEQELRVRLRKANGDINKLSIEVDELKRSLRQNRDYTKEELAEQNEQLKQELSALERRVVLGMSPINKKQRGADKENRDTSNGQFRNKSRPIESDLADIKKENARLKKDLVALAKDRESVVSKMMIEQERFRILLKEESEKFLDKKKELRDAKTVRAGMSKQLEDLAATVIQLRQKTEVWADYEQIKAERDQLRKLFAEKQFDLSWVQGNPGSVDQQDKLNSLMEENQLLRAALHELEDGRGGFTDIDKLQNSRRFPTRAASVLEAPKAEAALIHNFLLSVENLRLMNMMRQFVSEPKAKKVESGVARLRDRDEEMDPRFELDYLRQENHRLKLVIDSMDQPRVDLPWGKTQPETPGKRASTSKWEDGDTTGRTARTQQSHGHTGYSCDEALRILRVENKRLNEALTQSIREVEGLKKSRAYQY